MQQYALEPPQQPINLVQAIAQPIYNPYQQIHQSHPHSITTYNVYLPSGAPSMVTSPIQPINFEWEEMNSALKSIKQGNEPKTFKFEIVCPYSFDRTITMVPFLKHF